MTRVHIICEGQTEETFVNELLGPRLAGFEVLPVPARVGKPGHKGGRVTTERMTNDIKLRLLQDTTAFCTTFFDFYGMDSKFVGREEAAKERAHDTKAVIVERALAEHLTAKVGGTAMQRFYPYVQMYEFEGLLFSDPAKLAAGLCVPELESEFRDIRNGFNTPEEINDSRHTAPSQRILALMDRYEKPLYGSLAALEVGLDVIRGACERFDRWVCWMEGLKGR